MFSRIVVALASVAVLTGCAQAVPIVGPSGSATPAPTVTSSSEPENSESTPSASDGPTASDDYDRFMNAMATTCLYAQGVGVMETISEANEPVGVLFMLPKNAAVDDGYTAGWVPANGDPAEVIFETDAFESCYLANMDGLSRESGSDLRNSVTVAFEAETNTYRAVLDFGDFQRTVAYEIGEGGIVYKALSVGPDGSALITTMTFGMPQAVYVDALKAAVAALNAG